MTEHYVHQLDPIAFELLGLPMPWYWLAYFFGYFWILWFAKYLYRQKLSQIDSLTLLQFIFPGFFVLLFSGKIFYVLFYNLSFYLNNPMKVFAIWEGGMSFHGALLGCALWTYAFARIKKLSFWQLSDPIITGVPLVLMLGRVANFINGELAGRVSHVPWAVVFPKLYDSSPRHPSQIYEAILEGLILFIVMFWSRKNIRIPGFQSALFLIGYGVARFIVEFFRMPDRQIGFILEYFTVGQIYCLVMIIIGSLTLVKKSTKV
jgi:phosphatidylglycerol:prolipoprotein diacylglycerol transferase